MSEVQNQIQEVEVNIEEAKNKIELMKAFQRLQENKDFQAVIESEYFEKQPSRLVLLKASPAMESDESQKRIMDQIDAIGHFRQFLMTIMAIGQQAERAINADRETLHELMDEEATV